MPGPVSLEWHIAWRHLGAGDVRPRWSRIVLGVAVFLLVVGGGMAMYAAVELAAPDQSNDALAAFFGSTTNQLQQQYGLLAAVTIVAAAMLLIFGVLGRFFNLLASLITFSVMLGCMALVVVLSLMSGFEGDLRDKILNQKAHVRVSARDGNRFGDYLDLVQNISTAPGVAGASPYLDGEVLVRSGVNRQGATVIGVLPDRLRTVSNVHDIMSEGTFESLTDPSQIPSGAAAGSDRPSRPWRLRHLEPQDDLVPSSVAERPSANETSPAAAPSLPSHSPEPAARALAPSPSSAKPSTLPAEPSPGSRAIDFGGHEDDWEDPAAELGDASTPPSATPKLPPAPSFAEAMRKVVRPSVVDDGWEDPVEELDLQPEPDASVPDTALPSGGVVEPSSSDDEAGAAAQPILLGRELAMEIAVQVGAPVQLITPIGRMTPAGRVPGVLATRVGGVFYSGMYEYDRKNVYIPLDRAQAFLRTGDRISGIEIKLDDIDELEAGKAAVVEVVERAGRGDDLVVETWLDLNRNLFAAMFLEKLAMFIALLFVVLVASFGILASNLMSVLEKAKEIAILKAMGSNDRLIRDVFVREGLCMGLLGAVCGILVGLALCLALARYGFPINENVYYFERLPVVINPVEVLIVGLAALVIVWGSSLYPAHVASRMRPVDGLRQGE